MSSTFHIFTDLDFGEVCANQIRKLKSKIDSEEKSYLLNVNRTEYIEHVIAEFAISPLALNFDAMSVSNSEQMIPAEHFPFDFNVFAGKSYPKQVIKYHIPFSGHEQLLRCVPNPRVMNSRPVTIERGELCFEIIDFYGDAERIKASAESDLRLIRTQAGHLEKNITEYNEKLPSEAESLFDRRKDEVMKQNQVLSALGVPVKISKNIPETFAVPAVSRKQVIPRPSAPTTQYEPEPTLDQSIYSEILKVINDTGHVWERLPSTYANKDEETLRDHFILVLEPHFQISTTGETFNKSGKTDILMRHEGKNVFVAECKFWSGAKGHQKTIDQLLSYLTWRDSKTAIVYFVTTREMTAPLRAIAESTPSHDCFVAKKGQPEEAWFQYEFHLPGDHSRPVHVSILCFHLPR